MKIYQIPSLKDNYIYVLRDKNQTLVIDPSTFKDVDQFLTQRNWTCNFILNTHHHFDHVGGNVELKKKYNSKIIGSFYDKDRIVGMDVGVRQGDSFSFCFHQAEVLFLPGHTRGHIAYWFKSLNFLFCGDALFLMGCGRLFEGTASQMCESLNKIKSLPRNTFIYCAHEYTLQNAYFALEVDPENEDLKNRLKMIQEKRKKGISTVPALLSEELKTNPFLRLESPFIRKRLHLESASDVEVFKKMRKLKDSF